MKKSDTILVLLLSSALSLQNYAVHAGEKPAVNYYVEAEKIILYSGDSARSVRVGGVIDRHCGGDGGVYYITVKIESGAGVAYIGFVGYRSGEISYEKKLPVDLNGFMLKKFMASGEIAYLLAESRYETGTGGILNRINLNSMEVSRLTGVLDYLVDGPDPVLLIKSQSGIALTRNEISVPVTLPGEGLLRISEVVDGRMVFVTNGDETEIIDIRSGKSLYHYAKDKELMRPDEYNLIIQAEDGKASGQDDREMVFYKVYIDGMESGRTDSGPAGLPRELLIKTDANKYHLIKLERWALNAARGRYDRENNIRQPKTEHIFIPMNRIVKLWIRFDGKNYHYEILPVYKQ